MSIHGYILPLAIWMGTLVICCLCTFVAWRALFGDRGLGRRRCPRCWYDMAYSPGMTCAECGHTARKESEFARTRRRPFLAVAAIVISVLLFANQTLNIFSMIGLLLLAGIVKKNSIILVEYANHAADRGATAIDAMLEAGPTRLRPILMTSIATMMAAVPAALGLGAGSETRMPMAIAVIGGLVVSTMLSLFVVPSFYVVADRIKRRLGMGKDKALGRLGGDDDDGHGKPGGDDGAPPLSPSV